MEKQGHVLDMWSEEMTVDAECNDICLYAGDIGLPEYGNVVAYAHPDCPLHGDPLEEGPEADICGNGAENLRYVREEDINDLQ